MCPSFWVNSAVCVAFSWGNLLKMQGIVKGKIESDFQWGSKCKDKGETHLFLQNKLQFSRANIINKLTLLTSVWMDCCLKTDLQHWILQTFLKFKMDFPEFDCIYRLFALFAWQFKELPKIQIFGTFWHIMFKYVNQFW